MSTSYRTDLYGRTASDRKELRAKIDAINAEARERWEDPVWRREMAADITETIYQGFQHENLLGIFANVENLGWEDRSLLKEVRGLRAFWVSRGGYIEASELFAEVFEIQRDLIGFHVYELEDKLRANFAETQANVIDLGIQRMDAEINRRALRLFQAAVPSSSPYYIAGPGLTLAALNTAIAEVQDETQADVAIIGRATMTQQIIDELTTLGTNVGFTPETNEQILNTGVIGRYRGARILTLRNFKDDQNLSFFPANEMYVLGRDASKFAFWGGLESKEFVEQGGWYWHYMARREFGGVVHRPERIRRIVDSSITP
jgi:hypothetical protein